MCTRTHTLHTRPHLHRHLPTHTKPTPTALAGEKLLSNGEPPYVEEEDEEEEQLGAEASAAAVGIRDQSKYINSPPKFVKLRLTSRNHLMIHSFSASAAWCVNGAAVFISRGYPIHFKSCFVPCQVGIPGDY